MTKKDIIGKVEKDKQSTRINENKFPIVGIGTSAGGLEALELFFENMPENSGMAFVVIQHLDPNHKGILPELLQRLTLMKVFQITDRLKVKPNCIYVIPPNKSISLLRGALHLFEPVENHGLRLPIDIFFRSLANDQMERSIGIVLSGMGSDGSLGLQAIKEQHGLVLVQDPKTAKFDAMPRNAIDLVIADVVAPANDLPKSLISILKLNPPIKEVQEIESKTKSNIDKIILLIREQTGHDFSLYKKTTLFRRIERRKSVHEIDKIANYVRFLQQNPKEIEILFKELLIGVTNFFRDPKVWEMLKKEHLSKIINQLPNDYVMRAWVPGCSTGEEAYSLAILFKEAIAEQKIRKNISLQIFATDLDEDAIDRARKGYFPKNISADLSAEQLNRYFTPDDDGYLINTSIREMIVFAPQNVVKDPPFTKLDILTCRNMLIYMESDLQNKLISLFHYSLKPDGILVLGTAETFGLQSEGFIALDSKLKIFKKSPVISAPLLIDFPSSFRHSKSETQEKMLPKKVADNIQTIADQIIIQEFAPASVLVNQQGDIIYISGRTGKYLEPAAGKANWNIHSMAREGLRHELPSAFRKAIQSFDPVVLRSLNIGTNGGKQLVDVTIKRIENPTILKGMIMIVFTDLPSTPVSKTLKSKTGKQVSPTRIQELESELKRFVEENQSIREEMQTSQEELKSTNEELQSTNEELQSTNEELTTSKEEMQSLNEELQTVNAELQSKILDYVKSNDDMKNLLNSTEIATLFLDKKLNIRRFTDPVTKIFKLRNSDFGRPFTDLVSNLQYPEIDENARNVIKTLIPVERAIHTNNGKWYNVRIMPYRTADDRIDGLVITFSDITIAKKLEIDLKEANKALRNNKNEQG